MKSRINICHIYLGIILLCALNGTLYAAGGMVSTLLQAVLILISMFYVFYANNRYNLPSYFKALNVLLVMFTIYGIIMMMMGERSYIMGDAISNTNYLKGVYLSLLPIYAFYVFAKKGYLKESTMKTWFFVFFVLALRAFFRAQGSSGLFGSDAGLYEAEFTNNVGYTFVALLPALILFHKKPVIEYLGMIVCGLFILLSLKRGAIVCGSVCILWYLFINLKKSKKSKKWIILLAGVAIVLVSVYTIIYLRETSNYFVLRMEQTTAGESSGRDSYFTLFFNYFLHENNSVGILFGNGADATLRIGGNYAHNDWLEILINQGLIGLIIFLVYWISFYKTWRKTRVNPQAFMAIGMFFIIYFLSTLFSMSYNAVARCAAMVLGYYLATGFEKPIEESLHLS